MSSRKEPLVNDEIYHVYTRSIAGFNIFRSAGDYRRMTETLRFYTAQEPPCKFSVFLNLLEKSKTEKINQMQQSNKIVNIIAYCVMPTHLHLVLKQTHEGGISKYINIALKSYSKYFNIKYERLGPLWESRFKSILVETDEYLLHLTRYVHLNPVSASLVDDSLNWEYSSYSEYLDLTADEARICEFSDSLEIKPETYKIFVEDRKDYQRQLEKIKHLLPD
jgi:putative transposase